MLRVNVVAMLLIFLVVLSGIPSVYSGIYWEPSNPVPEDTITIIITNCTQGGKLHWGVNGWKQPIQAYWPPGSTPFDIASIESPLSGPDANKICTIKIGPFTNPAQPVKKIDFVIHWNDGSWDNNFGRDYHITLLTGIYWLPTNPTPNDTILVIIDNCTQGGNLHWGVNAEGRKWTQPIPGYWPNGSLVADPTAIESPLQGPDVNGQCTIRLGPFNSGAQMVRSVDFVIHWNDDSWDNNGKLDYHIFLNLTPGPLDPKVSINSPSDGAIVSGLISIDFSASDHIGVELWIDGSLRYVATSSPFRYDWDTEGVEYGSHLIVAKAFNEAQRVAFAWITVWVLPSFIIGDPPPGTAPGATDNGDGTVTFALLAPGKSFVTIIGDWNPNVEVMNRTEKGLWWKVVPIPQGTYHYQYAINGNQRLCDPYARDVEWKYQGNEDWNPLNAKAVLKVAQESYSWNDQNFQVPELQDLIIYEIQTGDFSPQANFNGLRARLDYLSELGINAIELMPNYEFPGGISWGYNPAFYFAPETAYGTPEEFKQLVDAAHQKGIAVFMDMVFNHTDATSPLYQLYGPDFDSSPWYHNVSNPWGFPDLDHYKPATEALIDTVLRFWMDEYHIDGFRFDYTQGYDESSNAGRVNRIGRMTSKAKSHKSNIYLIAEHLPQETNIVTQTEMNSCWHDTFHDQMKANLREGTFEGRYWGDMHTTAQAIHYSGDGFYHSNQVINYLESHDEQRVIWETQTNPRIDLKTAVKKSILGAAVLFTAAGVPMMYHGQEFGMDTQRTIDRNPLKWNKLTEWPGNELFIYYKRLIGLHATHPALRGDFLNTVVKSNPKKTIVYHRIEQEDKIVVIANFSNTEQQLDVPFPSNGVWYEFMDDDSVKIDAGILNGYTIPASEARIFCSQKNWEPLAITEKSGRCDPISYQLYQNFPNPFNASTTVRYTLAGSNPEVITATVYNLLGQKVKTLIHETQKPGTYTLVWDGKDSEGRDLPSGIYVFCLESTHSTRSKKMLLLR